MGRLLGEEKVVATMEEVLREGKEFDDQMTRLAEEEINPRMLADNDADDGSEAGDDRKRGRSKRSSRA